MIRLGDYISSSIQGNFQQAQETLEVDTTLLSADLITVQTKCLTGKDNLK